MNNEFSATLHGSDHEYWFTFEFTSSPKFLKSPTYSTKDAAKGALVSTIQAIQSNEFMVYDLTGMVAVPVCQTKVLDVKPVRSKGRWRVMSVRGPLIEFTADKCDCCDGEKMVFYEDVVFVGERRFKIESVNQSPIGFHIYSVVPEPTPKKAKKA